MATKYTKSARIGDQGIALVRKLTTEAGAIFRPFDATDLGVDGAIELLTSSREPSGDLVLVQAKAGASYIRDGRFYLDADKDHFETWSRYGVPVVGIVCDLRKAEARWVDISDHLRQHPEVIVEGPFTIEAPGSQPFSAVGFRQFIGRFQRRTVSVTTVDATPNLLIRAWHPSDTNPVRVLLSSIEPEYPAFKRWLDKQFADPQVSKKVVAVGGAIAAFSMWKPKDDRNVKLQTFMVGSLYRGTAVGQHLLYHEIRTWAAIPAVERVHVTVSSSKPELIAYFRAFGFRVEGIAVNRYPRASNAAECILTKHFLRETIRTPAGLRAMADRLAGTFWGISVPADQRFGVSAADLSFPLVFPQATLALDEGLSTPDWRLRVVDVSGQEFLRHDDESLMREFYPLRIHLKEKRYVLVPIYPAWAEAMLSTSGPQTPLKLRVDNAYYCYPKLSNLAKGDFVIFYETKVGGGRGAAIGDAIVVEVRNDTPSALYACYSDLGVYKLADINAHRNRQGNAMAIRFGLFEPYLRTVGLARIRGHLANRTNVEGLTPITRSGFEKIRQEALS